MLFNSSEFIYIFLPVVVLIFILLHFFKLYYLSLIWLIFASIFFYSYWNRDYLILLLFSIIFNYTLGYLIQKKIELKKQSKIFLISGIIINLGFLVYFKYTHFFVDNINRITVLELDFTKQALPLAISFFTFQQIAYLVDIYQAKLKGDNFLEYCLFVTFFPQLIAGPIVHYSEMLPQFHRKQSYQIDYLSIGLTVFVIGLFKKVILADTIAIDANSVFNAVDNGQQITFLEAWTGALAYTFQLYFDFSGYSDMAIGIAKMFGISLPLNFNSPYKSLSITDFWRRWHMTLSRFLRDYLYIPLGGNRKGNFRRYINLMTTMLLGGLWHGAGWTFIIWGGLHGIYLVINNSWSYLLKVLGYKSFENQIIIIINWLLTFVSVVVAWVFFRSKTVGSASQIIVSMFALNDLSLNENLINNHGSPKFYILVLALLFITLFMPNTQEFMNSYAPALSNIKSQFSWQKFKAIHQFIFWQPSPYWATIMSGLFFAILTVISRSQNSEFLYFEF